MNTWLQAKFRFRFAFVFTLQSFHKPYGLRFSAALIFHFFEALRYIIMFFAPKYSILQPFFFHSLCAKWVNWIEFWIHSQIAMNGRSMDASASEFFSMFTHHTDKRCLNGRFQIALFLQQLSSRWVVILLCEARPESDCRQYINDI